MKSVSYRILLNIKCMFVLSIIPTKLLFYCTTLNVGLALIHTVFENVGLLISITKIALAFYLFVIISVNVVCITKIFT